MKKFIFIILFASVVGCTGPKKTAGINDSNAPSQSKIILVHTSLDAKTAYKKVAQVLQDRGYTLRTTDSMLKSITTDFNEIEHKGIGADPLVRLNAHVEGETNSTISIRGWLNVRELGTTEQGTTIEKRGGNNSPIRNAWKEMYQVANSISDSLSYE